MKINNLKLSNFQLKLFLQIKSEAKAIKISVLFCLLVSKFNVLLKCLLPYAHLIVYPKIYGQGGFRPLLKQMNFCLL